MTRKLLAIAGLALAAVLFVAVNVLADAGFPNLHVDLTEDKLYTLSAGSRHILSSLKHPIVLRLYYSEGLSDQFPQIEAYANRVRALLEQYAVLSRGKIRLETIDPEPFTKAEDQAVSVGIRGVPVDQQGDEQFYFGLEGTNSTNGQQVIPFLSPSKGQFLEYDLTRLVYNLEHPKKPVVGVISKLPLEFGPGGLEAAMRGQSRPYAIVDRLRQLYDVDFLQPTVSKIPAKVDILLVVYPQGLSAATRYAIDQFVLKKGRAMVFVDPYSEEQAAETGRMGFVNPSQPLSANLPQLFKSWGLRMVPGKFVADRKLAIEVDTMVGGRHETEAYPAWISVGKHHHNDKNIITASLSAINMASAGALEPVPAPGTKFVPLLTSSREAELMDTSRLRMLYDPASLLVGMKPTGKRYVLAADITGKVKSAFPDGPPKPAKATAAKNKAVAGAPGKTAPAPTTGLKESTGPVNIIVVADSDMLRDRFWLQDESVLGQDVGVPVAANADFVINGIDYLNGSHDLISLRSRGSGVRPFLVVEKLRREAEQRFLSEEQALQNKLKNTERKLSALQDTTKGGNGKLLLTTQEKAAIDSFRQQLIDTRQQLRRVQLDLNKDIDRLDTWLKFINIGLMPILVILVASGLGAVRWRRRKARVERGH